MATARSLGKIGVGPVKGAVMPASSAEAAEKGAHFEHDLPDLSATEALGRKLAALARPGDVIALEGALGAGKTSLARAFIRALTAPAGAPETEEIPSPTFTLVQVYEREPAPVWHFDLYRLERPEEVYELGFEEALAGAISLIEWPGRLGDLLPDERLDVTLCFAEDNNGRHATITGHGAWRERLADRNRGQRP